MIRPCVVLIGTVLCATGCSGDPTCPAWSFPAVQVHIESATDGSAIVGAIGEVQDGQYRDSLQDLLDGNYMAAENRPGTYAVHVERAGYSPWDTSGVFVEQVGESCARVETEFLEVDLEPAP